MKEFRLVDYNQAEDLSDYVMSVKQAVCAKCLDCCAFQASEVKNCNDKKCSLYKFKEKWFKTPHKYTLTEEEKLRRSLLNNKKVIN